MATRRRGGVWQRIRGQTLAARCRCEVLTLAHRSRTELSGPLNDSGLARGQRTLTLLQGPLHVAQRILLFFQCQIADWRRPGDPDLVTWPGEGGVLAIYGVGFLARTTVLAAALRPGGTYCC